MALADYLTPEAAGEVGRLMGYARNTRAGAQYTDSGRDRVREENRAREYESAARAAEYGGLRLDADPEAVPPYLLPELARRLQARLREATSREECPNCAPQVVTR